MRLLVGVSVSHAKWWQQDAGKLLGRPRHVPRRPAEHRTSSTAPSGLARPALWPPRLDQFDGSRRARARQGPHGQHPDGGHQNRVLVRDHTGHRGTASTAIAPVQRVIRSPFTAWLRVVGCSRRSLRPSPLPSELGPHPMSHNRWRGARPGRPGGRRPTRGCLAWRPGRDAAQHGHGDASKFIGVFARIPSFADPT
jgi:hypothetical protein